MEELQNEEKKYCVYIHTNKINNKVYIGYTSKQPQERWGNNGSKYPKSRQPVFWRAIKKYGWDNFEHIIFAENLTREEAIRMEIDLIALYKANCNRYKNPSYGYNMTDGGEGCSGIVISEAARKRMSDNHADVSGEKNPNYGREYSEEDIARLREAHKHEMKAIVQLDLSDNFIAQYESIREANRKTRINRQCLSFCLQGKYEKAGGFHWMYKKDYEKITKQND